MLQTLAKIIGAIFIAGFCGAFLVRIRHFSRELEKRIESPWSAYDRSKWLDNVGFYCGAAGGAITVIFSFVFGF
jgi:hypothetical protein